jgi:carboxyl-terminal processing protease
MIRLLPTIAAVTALSVGAPRAGAATRSAALVAQQITATSDTGGSARGLDSALAVATFDSAWKTIGVTLEGRGVTRLDWNAVARELRPRAAKATSESALRAVIDDMLGRLGESHFALIPSQPSSAESPADKPALGTAGLELRILDGQVIVWRADSAGAGRRAGVAPGWVVERIDGYVVPTLGAPDTIGPRRLAILAGGMRALRGTPGATVRLTGRDLAGSRRTVPITLDSLRGPLSRFGNLPPLPAGFESHRRTLADGRCVAIIHYEYWLPPVMPALDRAVDASRTCAGMIIDLRGNLGGVAGMMMGVAGHFLQEPRTLGVMRTRGEEVRFAANPRRATDAGVPVEPFSGDLAILVDGFSASTSEMFAAAMQALGRARIFGERTAGQALPAMATRLPTGDVLMHVVADFVAPDGSKIEGRGVVPDELIPLSRSDLGSGRDAPLEAALRWIGRPGQATR